MASKPEDSQPEQRSEFEERSSEPTEGEVFPIVVPPDTIFDRVGREIGVKNVEQLRRLTGWQLGGGTAKPRSRRGGQCAGKGTRAATCQQVGDRERPTVVGKMGRFAQPDRLIKATDFSGDPVVNDPIWLVKSIKQTKWVYRQLKDAADGLAANWGRRREAGEWALAFIGFLAGGMVDMQPWYDRSSEEFWKTCGFDAKPPYIRVYTRFVELEKIMLAFREAAGRLIKHARAHDARVGAHVHVDSTEAESNTGLVHECCKDKMRGRRGKVAKRPQREPTSEVRARRHEESAKAAPDRDEPVLGDAEKIKIERTRKLVRINGHWYSMTDKTAGIRAYTGPRGATRWWIGYYDQKMVDHFTGGVLAVDDFNASTQEYYHYPELFQQLVDNVGALPETMTADRGFSISSVFEHNTRKGVASVFPWRASGPEPERRDFETLDRHGIPRCKHCGSDTNFIRFSANGGSPRLWYRCRLQRTPACANDQTKATSHNWRLLIPLWRTDSLYHTLQASHESTERAHDDWRQRYKVAGDNRSIRPKRRGVLWQRLRSAAAMLIEWFRICYREGWLGSAQTSKSYVKPPNGVGKKAALSLIKFRRDQRISTPYGPAAERLGIGPKEPPSERAGPKKKP
jgi:hypothetical protein